MQEDVDRRDGVGGGRQTGPLDQWDKGGSTRREGGMDERVDGVRLAGTWKLKGGQHRWLG